MQTVDMLEQLIADNTLSIDQQVYILQHISEASINGEALASYVQVVKRYGKKVIGLNEKATDIVGTGADGSHSFNVSTTAAFVIAGADILVAKHGNRSTSSLSGSFDCLQALSVTVPETSDQVLKQMHLSGLSFLFAPFFYPALTHIAAARKALAKMGKKNIFQLLGPLLHPGEARYQVIGVYAEDLMLPVAEAMQILGVVEGAIVHCEGLDELSLLGENKILRVNQKGIKPMRIDLKTLGLQACHVNDLKGGEAMENAKILTDILKQELLGPKTDTVLLNATMGIDLHVGDFHESFARAKKSLSSGKAMQKLTELKIWQERGLPL